MLVTASRAPPGGHEPGEKHPVRMTPAAPWRDDAAPMSATSPPGGGESTPIWGSTSSRFDTCRWIAAGTWWPARRR